MAAGLDRAHDVIKENQQYVAIRHHCNNKDSPFYLSYVFFVVECRSISEWQTAHRFAIVGRRSSDSNTHRETPINSKKTIGLGQPYSGVYTPYTRTVHTVLAVGCIGVSAEPGIFPVLQKLSKKNRDWTVGTARTISELVVSFEVLSYQHGAHATFSPRSVRARRWT